MRFEVFIKLNQMEHLFPKFDVSINADSDYEIAFGRGKYVVDSFFVHIADLVEVS